MIETLLLRDGTPRMSRREQAGKALQALDMLEERYREEGVDLSRRPTDLLTGALDNFEVAQAIAMVTQNFLATIDEKPVLAEVVWGPTIEIGADADGQGQVVLVSERRVRRIPLSADKIRSMWEITPLKTRRDLLEKFGSSPPKRIFDETRATIEYASRRHFTFSLFNRGR